MKILPLLLAGSAFAMTSAVAAQTMPEQPTTPAASAAEAPTATASDMPPASTETEAATPADAAATPATFTDEQIASFAAAALKIQSLDKSQPATQEQLMQIVTESGLDAATYVAINNAMAKDAEVAKRVQVAAAELNKTPAG